MSGLVDTTHMLQVAGYLAQSGSKTVGPGYEAPGGGVESWGAKLILASQGVFLSGRDLQTFS